MPDGTIDFTLEVFGEVQVARRLSRFGEGVTDFRPAFESIVKKLREASEDLFNQAGRGWPPLSPAYAAWKAIHFPGKPIMRRTDALYKSLTEQTSDSILSIEPLEMRWGTQLPYARAHQLGIRVPQRRVIDLSEEDRKGVLKELQKFVVSQSERGD